MVPFHNHFHAFLYLRKDGVRVAGEIGIADVKRPHITMILLWRGGGPDRTRICDLLRVKQTL